MYVFKALSSEKKEEWALPNQCLCMFVLVGVVRFEWKTVDGSPREMIKFKRILAPIPENFKTESFILLLLSRQFAFCFLLRFLLSVCLSSFFLFFFLTFMTCHYPLTRTVLAKKAACYCHRAMHCALCTSTLTHTHTPSFVLFDGLHHDYSDQP